MIAVGTPRLSTPAASEQPGCSPRDPFFGRPDESRH